MTQKMTLTAAEFGRLQVALSDTLMSGDDDYDEELDYLYDYPTAPDGTTTLDDEGIKTLCGLFADNLEVYANVLRQFAEGDGSFCPILDYSDDICCLGEGLMILTQNAGFKNYLLDLHEEYLKTLRSKRKNNEAV